MRSQLKTYFLTVILSLLYFVTTAQHKKKLADSVPVLPEVRIMDYGAITRTDFIIDRWPQPNFPNDLKGDARSVKTTYYIDMSGKDRKLSQTVKPKPVDSSKMADRSRIDTVDHVGNYLHIKKYGHAGLITDEIFYRADTVDNHIIYFYNHNKVVEADERDGRNKLKHKTIYTADSKDSLKILRSTYSPDNHLQDTHLYTYNVRHQLTDVVWTLYAPSPSDNRVLIDHFIYDDEGRPAQEIYDMELGDKADKFTYQYTNPDKHGNWRKAVCMHNGKLERWVIRKITYE